jgi:hypothetical protein
VILTARPDPSSAPSTASQRRDWNSHHSRPDNSFLNLPTVYQLDGTPDAGLIDRAVRELVERHAALRTRFVRRDGQLVQVIASAGTPGLPELSITSGPAAAPACEWLHHTVNDPFNLEAQPPLRVALLLPSGSGGPALLAIVMHHIISDHMSVQIALRDLGEILTARAAGREPDLPALPVQFPDYAAGWQAQERAGRFDRSFQYWADQLSGAPETTALPTAPASSSAAVEATWKLPVSAAELSRAAAALRTTPYVLLLAMFSAALADLTGSPDRVIACGAANRPKAPLRHGIGRFTSGIALRLRTPPGTTAAVAVAEAHRVTMSAQVHSVVALDAVLERGLLGATASPTPFANIAFQLVDRAAQPLAIPGIEARAVEVGAAATKRDLHVTVERAAGEMTLYIGYRPAALAPAWVDGLADAFGGRLGRFCRQARNGAGDGDSAGHGGRR